MTIDGGEVDGRVRRVQRMYLSTGASACDETVTCPRNVLLAGVESDE